jgi:hypothetical protein
MTMDPNAPIVNFGTFNGGVFSYNLGTVSGDDYLTGTCLINPAAFIIWDFKTTFKTNVSVTVEDVTMYRGGVPDGNPGGYVYYYTTFDSALGIANG